MRLDDTTKEVGSDVKKETPQRLIPEKFTLKSKEDE